MSPTRTSTGVDHPIRYTLSADHHLRDRAEAIADTYMDTIIGSILNQPRSLQKRIGPSEIGIPCNKRIIFKLAGVPEPKRPNVPWKPTIGTAVHDYLQKAFDAASAPGQEQAGRWLTEERVDVGQIGFEGISGSTDLFDTLGNCVLDHKITGKNTTKKYRAHGPSEQYKVQAHTYGKGWEDDGYQVDLVMICFLPREGELTDTFIWSAPYNRQIAVDALDRANRLDTLWKALGAEAAAGLYPPCGDTWCPWCGTQSSWPREEATANPFAI